MGLLIKGGEIVTAGQRYTADIWCEGETITRIDRKIDAPPGAEVINASGKYVFPGFIDPHTHIYLPFMGTTAKDDYQTASKAALLGGTTCFFDFVCTPRDSTPQAGFETWRAQAEGKSACDYGFHICVTRFDGQIESELRQLLVKHPSIKVFLAYKGALGVSDEELYGTLKLTRELGVMAAAHCENAELVAANQQRLIAEGKTGPEWHHASRPPQVEADGTHHFLTFAEALDAPAYIVHLSCEESLAVARRAKLRGVRVTIETLITYLLLDKSLAERDGFEGAKYVMSPPLRDRRNQQILWSALQSGLISTVGTDHAPFDFGAQKVMGKGDFTKIPNGLPALEDRVRLLYSYGVAEGRLDLHRFVDVASTAPARVYGLFPRKGTIQIGSDADLVVFDPAYRGVTAAATQAMNVDYSAFEGLPYRGRAETVTVRGQLAVRDGAFVGTFGRGRLLEREPTHF